MVSLASLLLPSLLSAVAVFFMSWLIHMIFKYHHADFPKLANQDAVMDALRPLNIPPGDYMMPCGSGPESMKDPAFLEKLKKGPVALLTVLPGNGFSMGKRLIQWFIFCLFVSLFTAYVVAQGLPAGTDLMTVFRFAAYTAFAAYALAQCQDSIWYSRKWSTTFKNIFDGLLYALATGGIFGAMWPSA